MDYNLEKIIVRNLVIIWQQSPELSRRFPVTEEGTHAFIAFVGTAMAQQLERE